MLVVTGIIAMSDITTRIRVIGAGCSITVSGSDTGYSGTSTRVSSTKIIVTFKISI